MVDTSIQCAEMNILISFFFPLFSSEFVFDLLFLGKAGMDGGFLVVASEAVFFHLVTRCLHFRFLLVE